MFVIVKCTVFKCSTVYTYQYLVIQKLKYSNCWNGSISVLGEGNSGCQLSDFSDPFSDFFLKKRPSDKYSDFWKTLATFQCGQYCPASREILSYNPSLGLLWSVSAGSGWEAAAVPVTARKLDIDVNELRMCTRCCHGPITCLLLLCLK